MANKQTKSEKKPAKKVEHKPAKQQHNQPKSNKNAQNGGLKPVKKQPQSSSPKKKSEGRSLLNTLLFLTIIGLGGYCFHVHCDGDYSRAGIEKALPRLQTNFLLVLNNTATALKPENLHSTGHLLVHHVNQTGHIVGATIKQKAYALQDYLEPHTGDLTPYTSKVSSATCQAITFISAQLSLVWAFIWKHEQVWRKVTDPLCHYVCLAAHNIWTGLVWLWSHPQVQAALAKAQETLMQAVQFAWVYVLHLAAYLSDNFPVWIEIISESCKNIASNIQNKINSMLK